MILKIRFIVAAVIWLGVSPAWAQQPKNPPPARVNRPQAKQNKQGFKVNPKRLPQIEQFANMSPEDRQKALAKLPPERRARMEQQLSRYQNLTPEQRDQVNHRMETLRSLPAVRQDAVRQQLQQLRQMRPVERRAALNSEELRQKFSPDELQLLRESLGQPGRF